MILCLSIHPRLNVAFLYGRDGELVGRVEPEFFGAKTLYLWRVFENGLLTQTVKLSGHDDSFDGAMDMVFHYAA